MNKRNLVVYIAGPFRASSAWGIAENIRRAERLALEVWRSGFTALCPHANTAHYQGALPDETWLDGDLVLLSRCDAVLMMPLWRESKGAMAERGFALANDIPIFYSLPELEFWGRYGR